MGAQAEWRMDVRSQKTPSMAACCALLAARASRLVEQNHTQPASRTTVSLHSLTSSGHVLARRRPARRPSPCPLRQQRTAAAHRDSFNYRYADRASPRPAWWCGRAGLLATCCASYARPCTPVVTPVCTPVPVFISRPSTALCQCSHGQASLLELVVPF